MTQQNPPSKRTGDTFAIDATDLPDALPSRVVPLYNGDSCDLRILPIRNRIGHDDLRMLGYNGSIPGPTMYVDQGSCVYDAGVYFTT
jgi:hypothetical protein